MVGVAKNNIHHITSLTTQPSTNVKTKFTLRYVLVYQTLQKFLAGYIHDITSLIGMSNIVSNLHPTYESKVENRKIEWVDKK